MMLIMLCMGGMLALVSTSLAASRLERAGRDDRTADGAIQSKVEEISGLARALVDDERGWSTAVVTELSPGGRLGNEFVVPGLQALLGEEQVLTVEVVTDERTLDADLGVAMGLPRDLNGSGSADDPDVRDDAVILPILVMASWNNGLGPRVRRYGFYVSMYR